MAKSKAEKRKKRTKALKLGITGETIFRKIINPSKMADQGQLHIDRIYAQGGFIVVQMLNYKTNEMEKRMLTPEEAAYRIDSLRKTTPAEFMPTGLSEAVIKACIAAKRQTLDGENEFFNANKIDSVDDMVAEIKQEISETRKSDPELNEEMAKAEAEAR